MYEELVYTLRYDAGWLEQGMTQTENDIAEHLKKAADTIEELSKRIDRAVELYNRGVEKSAMYEQLVGIAPEPPKEEA